MLPAPPPPDPLAVPSPATPERGRTASAMASGAVCRHPPAGAALETARPPEWVPAPGRRAFGFSRGLPHFPSALGDVGPRLVHGSDHYGSLLCMEPPASPVTPAPCTWGLPNGNSARFLPAALHRLPSLDRLACIIQFLKQPRGGVILISIPTLRLRKRRLRDVAQGHTAGNRRPEPQPVPTSRTTLNTCSPMKRGGPGGASSLPKAAR